MTLRGSLVALQGATSGRAIRSSIALFSGPDNLGTLVEIKCGGRHMSRLIQGGSSLPSQGPHSAELHQQFSKVRRKNRSIN
jgi:hypothetical protein